MKDYKYWTAILVLQKTSDTWYWKIYSSDTLSEYKKSLLRVDIVRVHGLGKAHNNIIAQEKLESLQKKYGYYLSEMRKFKKSKVNKGAFLWAILQTILALSMIVKKEGSFFAVTFAIAWIIGWWYFAITAQPNQNQ